jgi:ABC-type dipeptide/oligopeptide/nickel transport system permease component
LYAYGGWNEAAYISAELRDAKRNMLRTLLWSIGLVTVVYVLINFLVDILYSVLNPRIRVG